MKLIIAGGRGYFPNKRDFARLDALHEKHNVTEVISGGACGADRGGEGWARGKGIPVIRINANWKLYKHSAGFIRNRELAVRGEGGAVVLFPGGSGTNHMFGEAKKHGLRIFDWRCYELIPEDDLCAADHEAEFERKEDKVWTDIVKQEVDDERG